MENVVGKIMEIDKLANERLENAIEQKTQIIDEASQEAMAIRSKFNDKAHENLSKVDKILNEDFQQELLKLNEQKELEIKRMEDIFNETHASVEESIFKRIVGE